MLDTQNMRKRGIQIRGGRGTRGCEKGVEIAKNGGKGYPNQYDQISSRGIIRNLRQYVHQF